MRPFIEYCVNFLITKSAKKQQDYQLLLFLTYQVNFIEFGVAVIMRGPKQQ